MSDDGADDGSVSDQSTSTSILNRIPRELIEHTIRYGMVSGGRRRKSEQLTRGVSLMSIRENKPLTESRALSSRRISSLESCDAGSRKGTGSAGKMMIRRRATVAVPEDAAVTHDGPTPYERFRLKARAVKWLCYVCGVYMREASEKALKGSLLEVVEEILTSAEEEARRTGNDGTSPKGIISSAYPNMTFDATEFQRFSKREEGLPNKIKEILKLDEDERTPEQIQNIVRSMQCIEEFAKYPPEIQKRMCKYAWYDQFNRNRVVIRDQERAEGMYFVLSGKLTKTTAGQTYILKKGDKFGELDLINNTNRGCTVITKDNVELFCIHGQDYPEVFDTKLNVKPEDCLDYLKTLPIFKIWTGHDKLPESPANWGVQNYRAGQVIVPDSTKNEWMYIIKSGTCDVLKRLVADVCTRDRTGKNSKEYRKAEGALEIERMNQQMTEQLPSNTRVTFLTTPGSYSARSGRSLRDREPISGIPDEVIERKKSHSAGPLFRVKSTDQCIKKGSNEDTPYCVRVGELEAGDIFGIHTLTPGFKEASVSLVSQGSEAIKLRKSFFLKYADERVFTQIEMMYEPYPTQDKCLEDLEVTTKWQQYKKLEMKKTMKEVTERNPLRVIAR